MSGRAICCHGLALVLCVLVATAADAGVQTMPGRNGLLLFSRADDQRNEGLATLDLRAGRLEVRRLGVVADGRAWSPDDGAAWSPDGLRLAVGGSGIRIGSADGTRLRRITGFGSQPSWSPDGSRIVFAEDGGISVVRADGRGHRRLARAGEDPSWSPDGSLIAFEVRGSGRERSRAQVFVMKADGTDMRQITRDLEPNQNGCFEHSYNPAWQPDAKAIVYETVYGCASVSPLDFSAIWRVAPDGSGRESVFQSNRSDDEGAWNAVPSPDGRLIAFAHETTTCCRIDIVYSTDYSLRQRIRRNGSPLDWQPVCTRRGTERDDRVAGTARADLLCGLSGADLVTGGAGRDRLFGESGDDLIRAADGEFDVVGCGLGRDRVVADREDLVGVDCERVTRSTA